MPIADPYHEALRDALVRAAPGHFRREKRRATQRRIVFALLLALGLIASIVTVTLPKDHAEASIDIQTSDGIIYVRLLDLESRPDEIVAALRNAGIDATVELAPVGPSNVGRFVSATASAPGQFDIIDGDRFSFRAFSVAEGYQGQLHLFLGRPAADGEQWTASSDAQAKDEALSCLDIYGLTPAEATKKIADARVKVSITWNAVRGPGNLDPGAELTEPYAHWHVIDALATGTDVVMIRLTEDGSWPYLIEEPQVDPSCKGR